MSNNTIISANFIEIYNILAIAKSTAANRSQPQLDRNNLPQVIYGFR
jgi:hypothetical protein